MVTIWVCILMDYLQNTDVILPFCYMFFSLFKLTEMIWESSNVIVMSVAIYSFASFDVSVYGDSLSLNGDSFVCLLWSVSLHELPASFCGWFFNFLRMSCNVSVCLSLDIWTPQIMLWCDGGCPCVLGCFRWLATVYVMHVLMSGFMAVVSLANSCMIGWLWYLWW